METKKILVADKIAQKGIAMLEAEAQFEVDVSIGLGEAEICERVVDADAIVVRSATQVTDKVIESGRRLKVIGRAGIGVDNINVQCATERGIVVLNTPDANATTTAELAIAHILSLSRHLPNADASVRAGEWKRAKFVGAEVARKTLGVVGYGTIGRIVASRALGLKLRVIAHDPYVSPGVFEQEGVESAELDKLIAESDYISLHCPVTDATRNLLSAERLATVKPGARIINCARGGLIDEQALYEVLEQGRLAGAALDVYAEEPPTDSPLFKLSNIVFTPHLGASTKEAQEAVGVEIANQVVTFLRTGEPINAVNIAGVSADELGRSRPYQKLAYRLARLIALMAPKALSQVEVSLNGRAAVLDTHPVAVEALVGLLGEHLSMPVNQVNAVHLAKRQGIVLVETRSEETSEYLSLITVAGRYAGGEIVVSGTLYDDRHPRLVTINRYEMEAHLEGHLLITMHEDRPGVIGALGAVLGEADVNITRMQVGTADNSNSAVAVMEISEPLGEKIIQKVDGLAAIRKTIQISM